jgi:hypothetical protein
MTRDNDLAADDWQVALLTALSDAIDHLQVVIFEEGLEALLAETGSQEEALRESVATYERELARLFGILRASGALESAVAWSALKADLRRAALDAETEISLRTALETGLYAAESIPLGDHHTYLAWSALKADLRRAALDAETEISLRTALETGLYAAESIPLGDHHAYLAWSAALQAFLADRTVSQPERPASAAPLEERLLWAYQGLADIEDHDAFHTAFVAWLTTSTPDREAAQTVSDHQQRLLSLPRFDLFLNTSLHWLAGPSDV